MKTREENIAVAVELGFEESQNKPGLYFRRDVFEGEPVVAFVDFRDSGAKPAPVRGRRFASYADEASVQGFIPDGDVDGVPCLGEFKTLRDDDAYRAKDVLVDEPPPTPQQQIHEPPKEEGAHNHEQKEGNGILHPVSSCLSSDEG